MTSARHYRDKAEAAAEANAQLNAQQKAEALQHLFTIYPLLSRCQRNLDFIEEKIDRHYSGIWSPVSVECALKYIHPKDVVWEKPAPPPPPPAPPPTEADLYTQEYESKLEDWQLEYPQADFQLRRASKEAVKDYVARLHKRSAAGAL